MSTVSYAQAKEDIHLLRALRDVSHTDGFYIDIGANDPEVDSVTKLFYDAGWCGVNVEASPKWFSRLVEQRPRDINIEAAVSDLTGPLIFYDHVDGGLGTTIKSIADSHKGNHHVEMKARKVKTVTLNAVCEDHAPNVIHFLKIDVEGAEASVLRSMNFNRFRPWLMCIESHMPLQTNQQIHGEWDDLVLNAGYIFCYTDMINRYYVAKEQEHRKASFEYPADFYTHVSDIQHRRRLEDRIRELESDISTIRRIVQI